MNIRLNTECVNALNRAFQNLDHVKDKNGLSVQVATMPFVAAALILFADEAERNAEKIMARLVELRVEGRI